MMDGKDVSQLEKIAYLRPVIDSDSEHFMKGDAIPPFIACNFVGVPLAVGDSFDGLRKAVTENGYVVLTVH